MQQCFEDAELSHGQALPFELHAEPGLKRIRSAREIDKSIQGALCFRRSFEMSWQSRLTYNHLISKHKMQKGSFGIHRAAGLGFLRGSNEDFTNEALWRLGDDNLYGMSYIV